MELTYVDKQVFLYSKGWYKTSDSLLEDLVPFVAEAYALDKERVENNSVIHYVTDLYIKCISLGYIHFDFKSIVYPMIENKSDSDSYLSLILSKIYLVPVGKLNIELGLPNENFLPLTNPKNKK